MGGVDMSERRDLSRRDPLGKPATSFLFLFQFFPTGRRFQKVFPPNCFRPASKDLYLIDSPRSIRLRRTNNSTIVLSEPLENIASLTDIKPFIILALENVDEELHKQKCLHNGRRRYVGTAGFEPATPCTPSKCATGLRHVPKLLR